MLTPFARVIAAMATPFDRDLNVDSERLSAHARWLLGNGCDGLLLFGTTGEAASLSVRERKQALDSLLGAGIPAEALLVGTGCCALADTVELTRHAGGAGCAGALIVPPFYYKGVGDEGLARVYDRVVAECGSSLPPVYLYHIPQVSGVGISPALVGTLLERHGERIRGYKDSSGNWNNTAELLARFPLFHVYVGSENLLAENLRAGGAGCISAGINVQPSAVRRLADGMAGDNAAELHAAANAVRLALEKTGPLIPAVKAVLSMIHRHEGWAVPRPPLEAMGAARREALVSELRARGVAGL